MIGILQFEAGVLAASAVALTLAACIVYAIFASVIDDIFPPPK